jgi:hypothetical protein
MDVPCHFGARDNQIDAVIRSSERLLLFPPRQRSRENLCAISWTPLQQLAQFWGTDMIAMTSHVEVPSRTFGGEGCVTAIQVPRERRKCVGQLIDN